MLYPYINLSLTGCPNPITLSPFLSYIKFWSHPTQVDASTTRQYGGTGLGLVICKQIVELMGGEIHLHSEENRGSTFWFVISFQKQNNCPRNDGGTEILEGVRVLVIDDSITNCNILYHQLSSFGMRVEAIQQPKLALSYLERAIAETDPYKIAIFDKQMPELDGEQLGTQIKSSPNLKDIHLVMLTSLDQSGDATRMIEIGFTEYFRKPVRKIRLLNCLIEIISGTVQKSVFEPPIYPSCDLPPALPSSLKILLAEDSLVNQKVAINQLQSLGYQTDIAANGQEVLELFSQIHYDIVLMDCQMPILDGYSTSRQIRALEAEEGYSAAKVIIIALTANAMQEDRDRCLAAGMDDYLSKPVRKEDLAQKLFHWGQVFAPLSSTQLESAAENYPANAALVNNTDQSSPNTEFIIEIDWEYLEDIASGNTYIKQDLLRAFISSLPEHLEALASAISQHKYADVKYEAHFIKGSSAALGITGIAKLASIFEETSKQDSLLENAKTLLEQIIHGVEQIQNLTQSTAT